MRKNNRIAGFVWMIYVFLVFGFYGCNSGGDTDIQRTIGNKGAQTIPEPFHIEANDTLGIRLGMSLAEYLKRYPDSFRERPNPRNPDVPIGPDCKKEAAGRVLCTVVTASTDSFSVDGYKVEIYYLEFAGNKLIGIEYSLSGDSFSELTNSFVSKFGECKPGAMPLNQSRCIWRNGSSTIELWSIPDKHAASVTMELVDPARAMREKQEIRKNKWKAVYDDLDGFEKQQRSKLDANERCQKIGYYAEIHGLVEDDCADVKGKECSDQCRKGFGNSALFRKLNAELQENKKSGCQRIVGSAEAYGQNDGALLKANVMSEFTDPESVRFRNLELFRHRVAKAACPTGERLVVAFALCGEANPPNGMGGYAGYKKFYSVLTIDPETLKPVEDATWTDFEKSGPAYERANNWFKEMHKENCRDRDIR